MTYLEAAMAGKFKDMPCAEIIGEHCPTPLCIPNDEVGFIKCKTCWEREIPKEEEMTIKEKFKIDHPGLDADEVVVKRCPSTFGYKSASECYLATSPGFKCDDCWDQEYREPDEELTFEKAVPIIKDSGNRREFDTGAVRDIQEGKGRCDLMPLDVVASLLYPSNRLAFDLVLKSIDAFVLNNDTEELHRAIRDFAELEDIDIHTLLLDVSKHFEEGAKKYGENNWQKGIPTHCYIDSAVRHYLKYLRGDTDEPHDRAFVWNLMCCIWTCEYKPELNDYAKGGAES